MTAATVTADVLARILAHKEAEVAARTAQRPLAELRAILRDAPPPRGFAAAVRRAIDAEGRAVIAECKKASPSRGIIRPTYDPAAIARSYAEHGASCLSVLTDETFFAGHDHHLVAAREACGLPCLRKDFVVDRWQLYEARSLGADCVLLIVAALADGPLADLAGEARDLGLDVLVEVHDGDELTRALRLPAELVGINNRDLRTFATRLETTIDLAPSVPAGRVLVTESGVGGREDVARLEAAGARAFLIGETFMRAPDPGRALAALFGSGA